MDIDKIKNYVYYRSDKYISLGLLKHMIVAFSFLSFIGTVYGVIQKGNVLPLSLIIDSMTLLYIVSVFIVQKNWNPKNFSVRFIISGSFSLFSSLFFLLLTLLMIESFEDATTLYKILVVLSLLLLLLLNLIITLIKIRNNVYKDCKNAKKSNIGFYAVLGAIAGSFISRALFSDLSQGVAFAIVIIAFNLISMLFSFGTSNYLKCYYIHKYSLPTDELDEEIALQLQSAAPKKSALKAIASIVLLIAVAFLLLLVLIGIIKTN